MNEFSANDLEEILKQATILSENGDQAAGILAAWMALQTVQFKVLIKALEDIVTVLEGRQIFPNPN